MYCPNCAAPIEGVKFCRGCGTNVELVPQAISGELAEIAEGSGRRRRRRRRQASIENATSSFFTGIGFVLVALAIARFMPGGGVWWFWMLIPGLACIGSAVGQYLRIRSDREAFQLRGGSQAQIPQAPASQLEPPKAPTTSNLAEKASVTEHTTRHLG
jgi:hypothetical protein